MVDSWASDSQFNNAYEILSQENQEAVEAYRTGSPSQEQMDHLEQLLNVMRSLGGDVEQGLEAQVNDMQRMLQSLENVTGLTGQLDESAHDLENNWADFFDDVDSEFQRAQGVLSSQPSRTERITDRFSGMIGDEEDDSNTSTTPSPVLYPDQLNTQLEAIQNKFLNPLLRNEKEKTDQEQALTDLTQVLEASVELHQEANKYKLILLRARNDVRLQEELANHNSIDWFNEELMKADKQEQRLEREAEKIMEVEKDLIQSFERAEQLLRKIVSLDEDIIDTISVQSGERKGRAGRIIGSLASGDDTVLEMLEVIDEAYPEHNYAVVTDRLVSEFKPKIQQIERMEDSELRRERKLADELDQYIQEHQRLFHENERELEEEKRNITPEDGPVRDVNNGAPQGTREFKMKVEELRDLMNQPILRELKDAENHYKKVYRIDHDEIENIEDFHGRARELGEDLEQVERHFIEDTPFENAFEAQDGADRLKMEMERFMNGEGHYEVGLRQVSQLVQELQADIKRIYLDEEEESKHYRKAHEELEEQLIRIKEVIEALDDLETMVERFRDPDHPRNNINGEHHPYRAYHDAFLVTSRSLFDGDDREVQEKLHRLLIDIVQWVGNLEQEIQRIESIMGEIITEEHVEEDALKSEMQMMEGILENLEAAFRGGNQASEDVSQAIPGPITRELDSIDRAIREIMSHLEDIEQRKEGEERQFESEGSSLDDLLEDMHTVEDEGSDIVDETEEMRDQDLDDDPFRGL